MGNPIVFISRNRVKVGRLEDFIQHYQNSLQAIQTSKPRTPVQLCYMSEDAQDVTVIRLFPDAEALDHQLQGSDERSKITYQLIEPTSIEIFGRPSDYAIEMMKKVAGSGIEVSLHPQFTGGFIRSSFQ